MRHADIRTTFNIYGDVITNEMAQAHSKVVRMAIPRAIIAPGFSEAGQPRAHPKSSRIVFSWISFQTSLSEAARLEQATRAAHLIGEKIFILLLAS
jgi:hypothetical protein